MAKEQATLTRNGQYLRIKIPANLCGGKIGYISLGLDTKENEIKAIAKLRDIQRDIDYGEFDSTLEKYKAGKKNTISSSSNIPIEEKPEITFEQMLDEFEEKYFLTRKITRKSKKTFERHKDTIRIRFRFKKKFNFYLSKQDIDEAIELTDAGSYLRKSLVASLRIFVKCFKFKYEFEKGIASGYKAKERNLPTDEQIIEAWYKIKAEVNSNNKNFKGNAETWGWIFAVIATYGLRSHEVLAIDYEKSFQPPHFTLHINEHITDGTKTGSRIVYPLPFDWVNMFDITNIKISYLEKKKEYYKTKIRKFACRFAERMRFKKIDFRAYDMRHRYALRGRELGYEVDDLARWMGHDVLIHTQIYQQYWTDDSHFIVYEQGLRRNSELEKGKQEKLSYKELLAVLEENQIRILELENQIKAYKSQR